jgi:hypothetical protein
MPKVKPETAERKAKEKKEESALLNALHFVRGAVAKQDHIPALTHFAISKKRVVGFNGFLALSCPVPLDMDVCPKASLFYKAIDACENGAQLALTETGQLFVKSGNFKCFIDCIGEGFPQVFPEGPRVSLDGGLLAAIRLLAPFVSSDASRPWANGLLFRGQSVFATNNAILVEYWLGYGFPIDVNIPRAAIVELLRIGEEPEAVQVSESSITFHFHGDRWLRAQTHPTNWPDVGAILESQCAPVPFQKNFFAALESLKPFVREDGLIYLSETGIGTEDSDVAGASVKVKELQRGCYNHKLLMLLGPVALTADFSKFPAPTLFFGDKLRGALMGVV